MGIGLEGRSGENVEVQGDGRMDVRAKSIDELALVSREKGLAFTWSNETYDPDAADTILGVQNTSATLDLYITDIWISCDTATVVEVHIPTAEPTMAGTAVTGRNLNTTSNEVAPATAKGDETGNTQGDVIGQFRVAAAGDSVHVKLPVILGQNKMIGVDVVTASTAASVTIVGFFA